ncbi:CyP450 monooxygenase [Schizopora paradoxa]|uniref:CyP450 monooxygenase n=1 Tax=Schizopora paradoxa TaxID=27342 RepID=A0A0H2RTB9_9AGAM|nr:CyP450 monooxygenase [Schizopora paradoxa]
MLSQNVAVLDACAVAAAVVLCVFLRRRGQKSLPRPPGPPGRPIIGNLLQIPSTRLWERAAEWGKEYGDLIFIEAVGMPILIINSYETAVELVNKRSSIYSSRPHITMPCDLEKWGWKTSLVPYGDELRRQRYYLHRFFQSPKVLNYIEIQMKETHTMLKRVLEDPDDYGKYVRRLPGSVILMNVYGHKVDSEDDSFMKVAEASVKSNAEANNYLFLDFLPMLRYLPRWFPGVNFHKVAEEGLRLSQSFRNDPIETTKRKLSDGTARECMTTMLFNENTNEDGSIKEEQTFCDAAATAYLGGSSTSVTAIMTFILAMLKNPEVQRKAQEEIDAVVGNERLPLFGDREQLPYVRAVCTEVLRWEIITPLAPPHSTTTDDEFRGYSIPSGTMVLINSWAMTRDENMYPEPTKFKPERWLPGGIKGVMNPARPEDIAFGYGRRVCPGQSWAEHILFIAASSILASFNIEKATGPDGIPIPPNDDYAPDFIRSVGPSKCKITPRSEKIASLIRQTIVD